MREYRAETFAKRVAYGQRSRKLQLVTRGIIDGFKVACNNERKARDLAFAFKVRSRRIERQEVARYGLRVSIRGNIVYVTRRTLHQSKPE